MTNLHTTLLTFEDWTLRILPSRGKRILLMLHGWTGDENSMWVFARNFPKDYSLIAPRAPHPAAESGYSWRAPAPRGSWPTIELMRPAAQSLMDLLDAFARAYDLDSSVVDVIGFSQGGAMTFTLGWLYPQRVRKMGILAGFAPEGAEETLQPGSLTGKHVFVAHGTQDQMVPIALAQRTVQLLQNAGASVTYCESEVGHKLSADCLTALETYLHAPFGDGLP
ncbi:MAG: alpha/beta fold hydrolase [Anaerolineales bacterium]